MRHHNVGEHAIGRERLWATALIAVHTLLLAYLACFRYIDGDEGFYLSAASQVAAGKLPYIDFFFPQMPYLPYVISIVSGHGFESLRLARFLCLVPAILTPVVLWLTLRETTERAAVRLFVLFTYCLAGMVLVWHSVAKTYAWTDLALMLLFLCLVLIRKRGRSVLWLAAGIAFGLAVNFRSVLVVVAIPAVVVMRGLPQGSRVKALLLFSGSALAVSMPSIYLLVVDFSKFYFDNLGFHFVRNPGVGTADTLIERCTAVAKFISNPQIWIIPVTLMWMWRKRGASSDKTFDPGAKLALWFAAVISLIYLLPNPVHVQYFEQALPFAFIGIVPGLEAMLRDSRPRILGKNRRVFIVLAATGYVMVLVPFAALYLGAIRTADRPYSIKNVKGMTQFISDYPVPGPILTEWTGAAVLSGREPLAGTEYIGFQYRFALAESLQREYHFPVSTDLKHALEEKIPVLYVVWNQPDSGLVDVANRNYHQVGEFEQFKVLARNERSR